MAEKEMKDEKALAWREKSVKHVVQNAFIDFRECWYTMPDDSVTGPYYTYSRKNYCVIAATDTEGKYICVRQFRQGIGRVTTEFPAGGIEPVERDDVLAAARRELQEETGYVSDEWDHLISVPSNATVADNYAHIFRAKNCRKVSEQHLDSTEYLHVCLLSEEELTQKVQAGEFEQAMHIMAWLYGKQF